MYRVLYYSGGLYFHPSLITFIEYITGYSQSQKTVLILETNNNDELDHSSQLYEPYKGKLNCPILYEHSIYLCKHYEIQILQPYSSFFIHIEILVVFSLSYSLHI